MADDKQDTNSKAMNDVLDAVMKANDLHKRMDDELQEKCEKLFETGKKSVAMRDAYGNSLLAVGNDDKVESFTNYGLSNDTLNWPLWLALYNDSWVFRRAIDKPAQDEIRCGVLLQGQTDKSKIYKLLKQHRTDFINLLQWGALFGGSVAVMMFDNLKDEDYKSPMDYNVLRQSKRMRMYVVDRWYGVAPTYDDTVQQMASIDFGKPRFYRITLADGHEVTFHHDYVLRYEHRTAPKLIKNGQLQGWGYAEGSHIINELSRDDKLKASIQSLVDKSLIEVIKMSGMRGVFMGADADNEQQLRKRLEMVNWGRSYNSLTFLDKEDEYQQNTYSGLGGLSDLLEKNMWLVSSALEMQGVLFGDLKSGFSNDTEALERYDETINGRCESYLRPVYEKFLAVMYRINNIEEAVEFEFNSLIPRKKMTDKVEDIGSFVNVLSKLLADGIIDEPKYCKLLNNFVSKGSTDITFTSEEAEEAAQRAKEASELPGL